MGRWTQYDEDEYRLPEGMKRIGYDADSGRYYFRGAGGSIWRGAEGAQFGEMSKAVSGLPSSLSSSSDDAQGSGDLESAPTTRSDGYRMLSVDPSNTMVSKRQINTEAYRTLMPFFLIIGVVLLLIWRIFITPAWTTPLPKICPEDTKVFIVEPGDNCWELSMKHGCSFDRFKELNPKVACEPLMAGTSVCLPEVKDKADVTGSKKMA